MGKLSDLLQGMLELLILKTISLEPTHGWAIAVRIQQVSGEQLQVQKGSLDAALHRLKQQGRISKAGTRPNGPRARPVGRRSFMPSPPWGRKQLEAQIANWNRPLGGDRFDCCRKMNRFPCDGLSN